MTYAQVLMAKDRFEDAEKLVRGIIARDKTNGRRTICSTGTISNATGQRMRSRCGERNRKQPTNLDYRLQLAAHYIITNRRDETDRIVNAVIGDPKTFPRGANAPGTST